MSKRFFDTPPPPNYVAGLGRGATGFTTRSDIGPARMTLDMPILPSPANPNPSPAVPGGLASLPSPANPTGYVAGMGRGMGGGVAAAPPPKRDGDDDEDLSESNYDAFEGYGGGFVDPTTPYDQDDKEADDVWEAVDKRMDSKRKERREQKEKEALTKYRAERPKIQQQFSDLKRGLGSVSSEEWDNLPEPGDHRRAKRQMVEKYTPAPDSLLERARMESEKFSSLDVRQPALGGLDTPKGLNTPLGSGMVTDLKEFGDMRKAHLLAKLKGVSDSVSGQTVVDPKGYLTSLDTVKISSDAEIGDIKKARILLKSVITTNPKHAPGWIAAARLEEVAGSILEARKIIVKGCTACPDNEDVWLENARLQTPENAKIVIAQAVKQISNSVKLWMYAASLESEIKAKKKVLRKGLENVPTAVRLWKAAVELEEPDDARLLLSRAVECVPENSDMWLALAKLETYENAKKVLNKAARHIPTDPLVWITAAMLEEANNNNDNAAAVIKKALAILASKQVIIDREQWIKEAEKVEISGGVATCQAIVSNTIGMGIDPEDQKKTWMEDAESCVARGCVQTARAIYGHALSVYPKKKSLWMRSAHLEKAHGDKDSLDSVLSEAVKQCPKAEILWLMRAKEKWLAGNIDEARKILAESFDKGNAQSEQIWLAAVKLEAETKEFVRAKKLLANARENSGTKRVWLKSAILERELGNKEEEKKLLMEALQKFTDFDKLWMMRAQWEERELNIAQAREYYLQGLRKCPTSIPLWICAAHLEEKAKNPSKARAILDKARLQNPKNATLWLHAIRVELRANNKKIAQAHLAKALQECPTNGALWAEAIEMEPTPQQKAKSVDALNRCDNDPHVIVAVAKVFWRDRKVDKTRQWLNRAVTLNPDLGDAWANFYKFEIQHGTEAQQAEIVRRCVEAEPHHGEKWCEVSKAIENSGLKFDQILKKVAIII